MCAALIDETYGNGAAGNRGAHRERLSYMIDPEHPADHLRPCSCHHHRDEIPVMHYRPCNCRYHRDDRAQRPPTATDWQAVLRLSKSLPPNR